MKLNRGLVTYRCKCNVILWHNFFAGCHTNNIENAWRWAKIYVRRNANVTDDVVLQTQLQCYMWHLWRGRLHPTGPFEKILEDISIIYPT